jgi:L-lactate dehydrogenase complex protein LldG
MTGPSTARAEILQRIQSALGTAPAAPAPPPAPPHAYRRHGSLDPAACLALLIDRLTDYDATVLHADDESALAGVVAHALAPSAERRVLVAPAFPLPWLPEGLDILVDRELSLPALDAAQAVITTCELAIASTGTLVLLHSGAQGRRAATLLPDHHICLVRRSQVYELVPEALEHLHARGDALTTAPITTISGPSATSDIEMTRIRGVHGPRRLTVILYGPLPGARS